MNVANVRDASSWFQVLQTTKQSQTAMMTLPAEGQSSEEMNVHEKSDQILLVIEGELNAVVNGQSRVLKQGCFVETFLNVVGVDESKTG
jgi:mannose-6-phosphate isomerase-like protein (cupin superfamily)